MAWEGMRCVPFGNSQGDSDQEKLTVKCQEGSEISLASKTGSGVGEYGEPNTQMN